METSKLAILVVDDEELVRRFVITFLSQLGYSCVPAFDGVDALNKMKENKIDAVITDIKMPKMDGILLTKEISKQYPGIPVMVMTAFDEEYSAGTAISLGAREFIKKPFSPEEFAIRLSKMIGDSETMKRVMNEKDGKTAPQPSMKKSEAPARMKDAKDLDAKTQSLVDDLMKSFKKD
jgi:CheY-like chemotaxis protein